MASRCIGTNLARRPGSERAPAMYSCGDVLARDVGATSTTVGEIRIEFCGPQALRSLCLAKAAVAAAGTRTFETGELVHRELHIEADIKVSRYFSHSYLGRADPCRIALVAIRMTLSPVFSSPSTSIGSPSAAPLREPETPASSPL